MSSNAKRRSTTVVSDEEDEIVMTGMRMSESRPPVPRSNINVDKLQPLKRKWEPQPTAGPSNLNHAMYQRMPRSNVPNNSLKKKKREAEAREKAMREAIVIVDDEDEDEVLPKTKRLRTGPLLTPEATPQPNEVQDADDEVYDPRLDDPKLYRPLPHNPHKLFGESDVVDRFSTLNIGTTPPLKHVHTRITNEFTSSFQISQLYANRRRFPPSSRHFRPSDPWRVQHSRQPPKLRDSFKKSAGPIGKIIQKEGYVVITSAVSGGGEDVPEEKPDPYNKAGTAVVYHDSAPPYILHAHRQQKKSNARSEWTKYYTVTDVQFDPQSNILATCGNDKKVWVWRSWDEIPGRVDYAEDELVQFQEDALDDNEEKLHFDISPKQLAFKPNSHVPILAIAEKHVTIRNLNSNVSTTCLMSKRQESGRTALATLWGHGPTEKYIFACSEPTKADDHSGVHKAFTTDGRFAFNLQEAGHSGDAMCLSPDGGRLALFTCSDTENILNLYDISRNGKQPTNTLGLSKFDFSAFPLAPEEEAYSGAVNRAVFSPDGIYLAVARNDNRTHVYDSRMLGGRQDVLYDFRHTGQVCNSPGTRAYGINNVEWIQSSDHRLGLVTGGSDGCVRLWTPLLRGEEENGRILAEASADIGYFSIGDRSKGEHELVVGDADGKTYVYEGLHLDRF
ncbi:hypothetical protein VNI00_002899 [Paramarasmius palmivorus]|uniref:WD40 repeat-like protein n=1 Tax=Paramarasmius palmivorus TaxID=297713 RepID=A0AAW0E0T4_9AGAR